MGSGFDDEDTVETPTAEKSKQIVAEYVEMRDLSSFDDRPAKLFKVLDAIEDLEEVPPHVTAYSLDVLKHAAKQVRHSAAASRNSKARDGQANTDPKRFDYDDDDDSITLDDDDWYQST